MRAPTIILFLSIILLSSCLAIEEEPILLINPSVEISAHIKDRKIYATGLINANPQVLTAGNVPILFDFSGELAIYNTLSGTKIDVIALSGGGQSQVYSVSADTTGHERFIVIASGKIKVYADMGNDGDTDNNNLLSEGDFFQESQFIVSELVN